jgi:predicted DNA-binding protein YlxM (UPF0122 family)
MSDDNVLDKTNRINLLLDFYEPLLTEKQRIFLKYYFHENYSLGEIASAFDISRQAVYEHIKRAEHMLDDYEAKLKLLEKHEARMDIIRQLQSTLEYAEHVNTEQFRILVHKLVRLD